MTTNHETVAEAALHLLWAIDGGYYGDPLLNTSAFVTALRIAVEAETGKSGYPREPRTDRLSASALGVGGRR